MNQNALLERSLERYGYTQEYLREIGSVKYNNHVFLDEDGLILSLQEIKNKGVKIVILPDFDVDGISAGCVFYGGLSLLGFDVEIYQPDVNEGYGFTPRDIDRIHDQWPECQALITCDVGITCDAAIRYAKQNYGWVVLVTDHHQEDEENTLEADHTVDPSRILDNSDFKGICGAYMAYHVVSLFARLTGNDAVISLVKHLSLFASLGSMGDLMPLVHDTRDVVISGIDEFNRLLDLELDQYFGCRVDMLPDPYVAIFENIKRFHFCLLRKGIVKPGDVSEVTYGFTYNPMLNSVKRMGASIAIIYQLLHHRWEWHDQTFDHLVEEIIELNNQRKALVDAYFWKLITDDRQVFAPYAYITDARSGILGLLAMKLMQHNGTSCLVLNSDGITVSGSGRLLGYVDPSHANMDYVYRKGHPHAFGISMGIDRLDDYCKLLQSIDASDLPEDLVGKDIRPLITIGLMQTDEAADFMIDHLKDYDTCVDYTYRIREYAPFGPGFPEPEFRLYFYKKDIELMRTMGRDNSHLKMDLKYNIKAVFFGGSDIFDDISERADDSIVGFAGRFSMNEFNGSTTLQFMISEQLC